MADSVKRIVPSSLPLDRAARVGKERERKARGEARKRNQESVPAAAGEDERRQDEALEPDKEKTKGKNLDINA